MELLHYRIYSQDGTISHERPVMVFLHGLGGSSAIWLRQVHVLRKNYDLVLIDMPSHGKSTVKLSQMELSFEAITQKIFAVLEHLEIKKATFIGCSMGTMFVKYILLTRPEAVDKFILIGGMGEYQQWFHTGIRFMIVALPVLPLSTCCQVVARMIIPSKDQEYSRKLFLSCAKHVPKEEMICWLKILDLFPPVQRMYLRKMPVGPKGLYITGVGDQVFRNTMQNEWNILARCVMLDNCGHVCNVDRPHEVNRLISAFQDGKLLADRIPGGRILIDDLVQT